MSGGVASGWEGGGGVIPSDAIDPIGPDGVARLLIPSIHEDLKTCIRQTRNGDTVYFQAVGPNYRTWEGGERGWHSWQGRCFVGNDGLWRRRNPYWPWSGSQTIEELQAFYETAEEQGGIFKLENHTVQGNGWLRIAGAPHVRVNGQLILCQNTSGEIVGPLTLGLLSDVNYAMEQCEVNYVGRDKAAITVQGHTWLIAECEVRCAGGTALRADALASLRLQECAVGGVLAYDSDGRLAKASRGLSAVYQSRVVAVGCSFEHTEVHKLHYNGGSGVSVSGSAHVTIEDSHFHSHDGVSVLFSEFDDRGARAPNKAHLSLRNSVLKAAGVALFAAKPGMGGAAVSVSDCTLHTGPRCPLWANSARPALLCELLRVREEHGTGTSVEEAEREERVHEYHRALFSYLPSTPLTEDDQSHVSGVDIASYYRDSSDSNAASDSDSDPKDSPDWPGKMLPDAMLRFRARRIEQKIARMKEEGIQRADQGMEYPPEH